MLSEDTYNSKVDIWSLGILCYELICGYHPFDLKNHKLNNIVVEEIKEVPAHVDSDLKDMIETMLNKQPEKRSSLLEMLSFHPYCHKS